MNLCPAFEPVPAQTNCYFPSCPGNEEKQFVVVRLKDSRVGQGVAIDGIRKGQKQYLVEWEEGPNGESYDDSWEPASFVSKDLIRDFEIQEK